MGRGCRGSNRAHHFHTFVSMEIVAMLYESHAIKIIRVTNRTTVGGPVDSSAQDKWCGKLGAINIDQQRT